MDESAGLALNPEAVSGEDAALTPPTKSGPFFERADWRSFWITTLLMLGVYLFTLCPEVELGYSGIFTTGAMYAGVPDTPGFPLWTIYAHCFTVLIPFSNVVWRVSVSSAVAAAVACGLIALMVSRMGSLFLENLGDFQRLDPKSEKWLRILSGYAAGMSFGLTGCVWSHAVIVDWWPLTFALFAGVICLLMRWSQTPENPRYLFAAVFIYGIALTNSQSLIVGALGLVCLVLFVRPTLGRDLLAFTTVPFVYVLFATYDSITPMLWRICLGLTILVLVLAIALAVRTRTMFTHWKTGLGSGFLLTLGVSLYLYTAITSMTNPPMNWGYPRTVEGFFHLVSRGQYERAFPVDNLHRYWEQIRLYGSMVLSDYGWIYLIPAAVPFFFLHRMRSRERKLMSGLLAVYLCESFFLLALLNPSSDKGSRDLHRIYFAPSFLVLAIWTGCGLMLLGTMLARPCQRTGDDPTGSEGRQKRR